MDDSSETTDWEQIVKWVFIVIGILVLLAMLFFALLLPSIRGN